MKKTPTKEKQPRKAYTHLLHNYDHIILADEKDSKIFFYMAYYPGANLHAIRILEIHLDSGKPDEYREYRLALALQVLHPRPDGLNPHSLQAIKLVVKGNQPYTRFNHQVDLFEISSQTGGKSKKRRKNGFSEQEEPHLPYVHHTTERTLAAVLLGIRGVKQVLIGGEGMVEEEFAETLKATLVQPPGMEVAEFT